MQCCEIRIRMDRPFRNDFWRLANIHTWRTYIHVPQWLVKIWMLTVDRHADKWAWPLYRRGGFVRWAHPGSPALKTRILGPDSSGNVIVTFFPDTDIYEAGYGFWTKICHLCPVQNAPEYRNRYWTLVPNQIYPWCTPVQKVRSYDGDTKN